MAAFVPRIQTAIAQVDSEDGVADWGRLFVADVVSVCLPGYRADIQKIYDPQEESK